MVCKARKARPTSLHVARVLVERQKGRFQFDEDFASFFLEGLLVLVEGVRW